ncbi:MAG: hypothetical protein JNK53_03535, partial [Phycisphaerae bacterium]|nr:hypothetical protein [Phycisphaerae bacterium]
VRDVARPVLGPYEWNEATGMLTLQTRRESPICGDDPATYKVVLSSTTMDAQVQRDSCTLREKLLAQPLKRVSSR